MTQNSLIIQKSINGLMFKKEMLHFFFKTTPHEAGKEGWGWKLGQLPKYLKAISFFTALFL